MPQNEIRFEYDARAKSLNERIVDFIGSKGLVGEMKKAAKKYSHDEQMDKDVVSRFQDWFLHDHILKNHGKTVMELFAAENALDKSDAVLLKAWMDSSPSIYEIVDRKKGLGVTVRDVFDGTETFLHDISLSLMMVKHTTFMARLHMTKDVTSISGESLLQVDILRLEDVKAFVLSQCKKHRCANTREYFGAHMREVEEKIASPDIASSAGPMSVESLKRSTARYRINCKPTDIGDVLYERDDFMYMGDDGREYTFVMTGKNSTLPLTRMINPKEVFEGNHPAVFSAMIGEDGSIIDVIATIRIGSRDMYVECITKQRLKDSKRVMEILCEDMIAHKNDEYEDFDFDGGFNKNLPLNDMPDSKQRKVFDMAIKMACTEWLQTSIPYLGNHTPMEAASMNKYRDKVRELLKRIEDIAIMHDCDLGFIRDLKRKLDAVDP